MCGDDKNSSEKRKEDRLLPEKYSNIEFSLKIDDFPSTYKFKLRDLSANGIGMLIKEDSDLVELIHEEDVLDMTYFSDDVAEDPKSIKTKIRHISKGTAEYFQGHYLVGFETIDE
ncbi:MAG: PilZ domain-containing protein [Desulfobacterales bacterium]|nr:PilZ domain-containing protein [Desulfobacterales bacterium]